MQEVELLRATAEMIEAELRGPREIGELLGMELPDQWPPAENDEQSFRWMLKLLEDPANAEWGMHYFVVTTGEGRTLAGTGGYTGPPNQGTVEIGYSVAADLQRRGIATEATRLLVESAFARGVTTVVANTLPHLEASIGVLDKLGFEQVPPSREGVITFALVQSAA